MSLILQKPVLILTVVSYALYTALVGVMGYWGPKAAKEVFNIDDADILMGVVTAFTGVGGTLLGGVVLDKLGSTMTRALYIAAGSCGLSGLLLIPCFMLSRSFSSFVVPFTVVCSILFLLAAPVNAVVLWCVPAGQRALATSFSVVIIHALGDVPSPTVFGAMLDYLQHRSASVGEAYRLAMSLSSLVLFVAAMIFFVAAVVARDARDYRPEEERLAAMHRTGGAESATPLLVNGTANQ